MIELYEHISNEKNYNCWVYILETKNGSCFIRYSLDLCKDLLAFSSEFSLLFFRGFYDIADGIAYKLFLEKLSFDSVKRIIAMKNPNDKNLRKEFLESHRKLTF